MKHRQRSKRWPKIATALTLILATVPLTSQVEAASANPAPVCTNGLCTVTFDYTGDYYLYTPPADARTLSFDVAGAQGGRSGGLGGRVQGTFASNPATIYIYVGGAGKSASAATGGFNGGGAAGSGHGDEGSGGGSSDIRRTAALDDRLVVAGGGGGAGGWIGGTGGAGGLQIAANGSAGAAAGGLGGTQLAGGAGGTGNAGNSGTSGAKLFGGTGGSASAAGGGGGGGGYFGGGGGGGDGIPSGNDGAGGGGGSSFASLTATKGVTHTAGYKAGNGQVVFTYAYAPTVMAFNSNTSGNSQDVVFSLSLSQNVGGLDAADFTMAGTAVGCSVSGVTGSANSYLITVSGCTDGTVALKLAADSVTGATAGPIAAVTSSVVSLDRRNPSFTVASPATPTNAATLKFDVIADEPVTGLDAADFTVDGDGCLAPTVVGSSKTFTVSVTGCASGGSVSLKLAALSAQDTSANSGPITAITSGAVVVDRESPWVTSFRSGATSRPSLLAFDLTFSKPVTSVTATSFAISGSNCTISKFEGSGQSYQLWLSDCAQGVKAKVTLKALTAEDSAGNLGPTVDTSSDEVLIDDTAPSASFATAARAAIADSPTFTVTFTEPVSGVTLNSFSHTGTAKNCAFAINEVLAGLSYRVVSSSCQTGSLRLVLGAKSVSDAIGNLGPITEIVSELVHIDRQPSTVVQSVRPKRVVLSTSSLRIDEPSHEPDLLRVFTPEHRISDSVTEVAVALPSKVNAAKSAVATKPWLFAILSAVALALFVVMLKRRR